MSQPKTGQTRLPRTELCELQDATGERWPGRIWNLSLGGVYIVAQPPALREPIALVFPMHAGAAPIRVRGRIAWWNPPSPIRGVGVRAPQLPPGLGVQFLDVSPDEQERISALVNGNS